MSSRRSRAVFLTTAFLVGTGCVATTGTLDLQKDLDDIQAQLWRVQKDTAALHEKVDHLQTEAPGPAVLPEYPPDSRDRLDAIQNQLQVLQHRLDEMNFRLDTIVQAVRNAWIRPTPAGPTAGEEGGLPGTESHLQEPQRPEPGAVKPEELFHNAYADYSKGNYQLAVLGFQEYVRRFPTSELADNAQYWVGECFFSSGDFHEAIQAFDELIGRYPYGDRLSSAHLKKGLSYLEENPTPQGVLELQYVIENFSQSDEARLAKEHLRRLGLAEP